MQPPHPAGPTPPPSWHDDLLPDHPRAQGTRVLATVALLLSFIGLGVAAPIALARAWRVRREVAAQPGRFRRGGDAQTGFVMSVVATVLFVLWSLALVLVLMALFQSS